MFCFQVLARRALLRYFFWEIESAYNGQSSIFVPDISIERADENLTKSPEKSHPLLMLRSGVNFHFFCSHSPCGDASIFLKNGNDHNQCGKRTAAADDDETVGPSLKKHKIEGDNDIYRTGAKCLSKETKRDPHLPGTAYHVVGAVRTKPGRGDRTLSVSCSDKLLRWHSCGIQVIS